jgi:hypothetical protein
MGEFSGIEPASQATLSAKNFFYDPSLRNCILVSQ